MDRLTKEQRSRCMSRVRGKNTKPEILVRKGLYARGFRFRLCDGRLPGKPDVVLPKWGVVVMVNGCFWHGHKGCRLATRPKSNEEFWREKIERNIHRDEVTVAHLEALGWSVITVWECELGKNAESRIERLAEEIRCAGEARRGAEESRRKSRAAARREREEAIRRLGGLQAEVDALFDVPTRVKKASRAECTDDC